MSRDIPSRMISSEKVEWYPNEIPTLPLGMDL